MKTEGHTPTPWAVNDDGWRVESRDNHGWANDGWIVGKMDGPDAAPNAHLIVTAVNERSALLKCEVALRALMGGDDKMDIAIGGNPYYVDRFLEDARAALTLLDEARK